MIHIVALMTENAFIPNTFFSNYYTKKGEGNETPSFNCDRLIDKVNSEVKQRLVDEAWEPRTNFITIDEIVIYNVARITAIFFDANGNYVRHGVFQRQMI